MCVLVLNLLVIILLSAQTLCGGGKNSLQNSLGKSIVSVTSADTFSLYIINIITCVRMRGPSSYAHSACLLV